MAVIAPARTDNVRTVQITWTSITTADTGGRVDISELEDTKTIHVVGSGTAQVRLSNDGTNFVNSGSALAANSMNNISTQAKFLDINPVATATVTVILTANRRTFR